MEERRLFAGFDGGGSKTLCALCDGEGTLLGTGVGGPSNFRYCGEETARQSMRDAQANAFADAKIAPQRLFFAYVSSATIPTYGGEKYLPFFSGCVDSLQLYCEGDLYPVWYGACGDAPGIVLIAGTGSVAYLFRGQSVLRAGGWGPQIGDEGSGYAIGQAAMRRVMRMYDGREPMDKAFYDCILKHYHIDLATKLIAAAREDRAVVASCARAVCALAENGNAVAGELIADAAGELCALIEAVLSRDTHSDALPLVLSGGLMSENAILKKNLCALLPARCPRLKSVETAKASPALVCAALALKMAGLTEASACLLRSAKGEKSC